MQRFVALFRGINVGGKHSLPMKELTGLLEQLGCKDVRSYIQSGNVTFSTDQKDRPALAEAISDKVEQAKGFAPKVWLLDAKQWRRAVDNNPFPTDVGKALHLFFLEAEPEGPDLQGLATLKADNESFALVDDVFYLHAPDGIGRSKLVEKLGRYIKVPMTARNWNTVAKLSEMLDG